MTELPENQNVEANQGMHKQISLGEVLSSTRNAKKLSQQDVSNTLRYSVKQIDALENNLFGALPSAMITRGFIRNYARLLELDAEPLLASYRAHMPEDLPSVISVQSSMRQVQLTKDNQPWLKYILGSILVLLFLVAWFFYVDYMPKNGTAPNEKKSEGERKTELAMPAAKPELKTSTEPLPEVALPAAERQAESPAVNSDVAVSSVDATLATATTVNAAPAIVKPADAKAANVASSNNSVPNTQTALKLPAESIKEASSAVLQNNQPPTSAAIDSSEKKVSMTFSEQTWVRITDKSGKVIYEKTSRKGDIETLSAKPPFIFHIGNAKGVKLEYSGQEVDVAAHTRNNIARITLE